MSSSLAQYDFVVLGGGSAGYAAARTAISLNLKTAVIDNGEELGGLCILRGCMPSKTLIESANRNITLRRAQEFGLSAHPGPVDTKAIRDRKRGLIHEFASYRQEQLESGKFTLLRGAAHFTASTATHVELEVSLKDGSRQTIEAKTVLISTGSVINVPNVPGLKEAGFWTSDTLLDAEVVPDSFVVLGGGAIALEMAHYLEGIGRRTTVVQRSPHVLTGMDHDLADVVRDALEHRGIRVSCGTSLQKVEKTAEGLKRVHFRHGETETFVEGAEILAAMGRRPAIESLDLATVGVEHAKSGQVVVQDTMQTTQPRIFAAGDVSGPLEVVHLAIQQGETAARNAASLIQGKALEAKMDYRCKLFGVFTHPQAASVGLSEQEAQEEGLDFLVAKYPFNDHGKSMVMGETEGFVKLIAEAQTGRLLGGSVVGPEGVELTHEIAMAMHLRATVRDVALAPHYHPTLSEIWTYPAEELTEKIFTS